MDIQEDPILQDFLLDRDISKKSKKRYVNIIKHYSEHTGLTPEELLLQAETDEKEGLLLRQRRIKRHLTTFKQYLEDKNYSQNNISLHFAIVRSFYYNFEIQLPRQKFKHTRSKPVKLEDLPDKQQIQHALSLADVRGAAIILLMSSSGMGSAEVRSLTVDDFFKSIETYVNGSVDVEEITSILEEKSSNNELLIGTWHITRIKTTNPYTTFSTLESIEAILLYLKTYPPEDEKSLFRNTRFNKPLGERDLLRIFSHLNSLADFGMQGRQIYFRSHNLRKFFTNTLYKNKIREFSIKWMLGRKIGSTDERYFKTNIEDLKEDYITCIPDLSMRDVEVQRITTEDKQRLIEVENDNKRLQEQIDTLRKDMIENLPVKK